MFAAPNSSSIMGSVPARQRGVASGMRATFQNSGTALSIGVFFSLMIAGLASRLPTTLIERASAAGRFAGRGPPGRRRCRRCRRSSRPSSASTRSQHLLAPSGALDTLPKANQAHAHRAALLPGPDLRAVPPRPDHRLRRRGRPVRHRRRRVAFPRRARGTRRCRRSVGPMTRRTAAPFRADHVGSLLRPPALLEARARHARRRDRRRRAARGRGRRDPRRRRACRRTSACSRRPTASSAVRRGTWTSSTSSAASTRPTRSCRCTSATTAGELDFDVGRAERRRAGSRASTRRSSATPSRSCSDRSRAGQTPKLTIPSPSMVHYRGGRAAIDPAVYPDAGRVLGRPDRGVRRAGAPARRARLHLPAARRHQPGLPQRPGAARAWSPRRAATPSTSTSATSARSTPRSPAGPTGMQVTTHMCRGNFRSSWAAEGGYDFVAEALFGELDVDGFFLEYDDERSGGFEPLRFVPPGKQVVLGLVTTKRRRAGDQGRPQAAHRRGREVRRRSSSSACRRSAASPRPSRATS